MIGTFDPSKGMNWTALSFWDRRNNLEGLNFRSVHFSRTYRALFNIQDGLPEGYFGRIFNLLRSDLNFNYTLIDQGIFNNGSDTERKTITDLLIENYADIAVGDVSITFERAQKVDFLDPLWESPFR